MRSTLADVRNPIMALESAQRIRALPPEAKAALRAVLLDIRADAKVRAEKAWRTHKAPMACYWKLISVIFGHIARLAR